MERDPDELWAEARRRPGEVGLWAEIMVAESRRGRPEAALASLRALMLAAGAGPSARRSYLELVRAHCSRLGDPWLLAGDTWSCRRSPDGRWVALWSNRVARLLAVDGPRRVAEVELAGSDHHPFAFFSPEPCRLLVVEHPGDGGPRLVRIDPEDPARVLRVPLPAALGSFPLVMAVDPGGTRVLLRAGPGPGVPMLVPLPGAAGAVAVPALASREDELPPGTWAGWLSPDSTRLFVHLRGRGVRPDRIALVDLAEGPLRVLGTLLGPGLEAYPAWSPDSRQVALRWTHRGFQLPGLPPVPPRPSACLEVFDRDAPAGSRDRAPRAIDLPAAGAPRRPGGAPPGPVWLDPDRLLVHGRVFRAAALDERPALPEPTRDRPARAGTQRKLSAAVQAAGGGSDPGAPRTRGRGPTLSPLAHRAPVATLEPSRDGTRVLSRDLDGLGIVWDLATGTPLARRRLRPWEPLVLAPDGTAVLDAPARRYRVAPLGAPDRVRLSGRGSPRHPTTSALALSPDGRLLALGSTEGGLAVLAMGATPRSDAYLPAGGAVLGLVFLAGGEAVLALVATGFTGPATPQGYRPHLELQLRALPGLALRGGFPVAPSDHAPPGRPVLLPAAGPGPRDFCWLAGGRLQVAGLDDPTPRLLLGEVFTNGPFAISPDGAEATVLAAPDQLARWRLGPDGPALLDPIQEMEAPVRALAYTPDGRHLLVGQANLVRILARG